jgi:5-methylcytosine-specific restriction enzyme A
MPTKAPSACRKMGCPGLVRDGVCSNCGPTKRATNAVHDEQRGNSTQRGYGRRWRALRLAYLHANPLCVECWKHGVVNAATDVDHIKPKRDGGTDDADNLQALCHACHSAKTGAGG